MIKKISNEKISLEDNRENFSSKFGFIISCVGAALGLGNIWMFPYKLGTYGGAAFLIPYFLFVFLLGTTGLIGEFTLGRTFKSGSMVGISKIFKSRNMKFSSIFSTIPVIGLFGIFMFYSIVISWILKYFVLSLTGEINNIDIPTYFDSFAGTTASIPWFLLSVCITLLVVCFGVSKGIEKLNKIIMPLLLLLFIFLTIRSISLPGAMAGVEYLLKPRWDALLSLDTWIMALGQAFFTVSLTGCGMVVYGSYTNDKFDIISSAVNTAVFDTIAALLAAFMIMPAVFSFGFDPAAGPSLLFITVPSIFKAMPYGNIISIFFFLSIIFAAISSSVSMLEGPVEALLSVTKISRKKASILISALCFVLALPLATNIDKFNSFTDFITIILSPIGATISAISIFFLFKGNVLSEINKGAKLPLRNCFLQFARFVFVPVTVIVIILGSIYGGIG